MTDLEQKIILNSYEIFPIEYVDGNDVNSENRAAYIRGGICAIRMVNNSFYGAFKGPLEKIPDEIIETPTEIVDGNKEERPGKLF